MRPGDFALPRTIVVAGVPGMFASHGARSEQAAAGATIRLVPGLTFQTNSGREATADIPNTPANSPWASYCDTLIGRAVSEGAVRIGADSEDPGQFPAGAFINPDGGHAVAVRARRAGRVTVEGLPPGRYRITRVAADGTATFPAVVAQPGDGLTAAISGNGIVTFVSEPR